MLKVTTLYHPSFSPQLSFFFASYDESCDSMRRKFKIGGVVKEFTSIQLKGANAIQKARFEGWLVAPEGSLVVEEKEKEAVFTAGPKKSRGKKKR